LVNVHDGARCPLPPQSRQRSDEAVLGCAPEGDGEGVGYIFNVGSAIIANVGSSLDHWQRPLR
jgi:hypothetical protein